jgi:peptidoglycan/LPS O-acetylase OafA/YrhL
MKREDRAEAQAGPPNARWKLGHRPGLDGLRGFAILLVLADHSGIGIAAGAGQLGVTIFFVLSGFLITTLLLEERARSGRVSFRRFYWRRALRLLPALAALLGVVALLLAVAGRAGEIAGDIVPVLFYVMNWTTVAGHNPGLLSHTWSLSIEEQFYFVWPVVLIAMLAIARGRLLWVAALLIGVTLTATVLRVLLWEGPAAYYRVYEGTDTRMDALAIGCLLAIAFVRRPVVVPPIAMAAMAAAILITLRTTTVESMATIGLSVTALAAAGMVAGAAMGSADRVLAWRPLAYLGVISYGLYLWHRPVMRAFTESGLGGVPWAVAVMFALSIGLALLSRRLIEDPFLRLKDRYFSSTAGTTAPSADSRRGEDAAPTSRKLIS